MTPRRKKASAAETLPAHQLVVDGPEPAAPEAGADQGLVGVVRVDKRPRTTGEPAVAATGAVTPGSGGPQPSHTLDAAPAYGEPRGEGAAQAAGNPAGAVPRCGCGSGKPVTRTGRCRSCASRLSWASHQARTQGASSHDTRANGANGAGGADGGMGAMDGLADGALPMVAVPTYLMEALADQSQRADELLADLRSITSQQPLSPGADFAVWGRLADWFARAFGLARTWRALGCEAQAALGSRPLPTAALLEDPFQARRYIGTLLLRLVGANV